MSQSPPTLYFSPVDFGSTMRLPVLLGQSDVEYVVAGHLAQHVMYTFSEQHYHEYTFAYYVQAHEYERAYRDGVYIQTEPAWVYRYWRTI